MERCASRSIVFFCLLSTIARADDRLYFPTDDDKSWNFESAATTDTADEKFNPNGASPQSRFLPFAASFTVSSGGNANNAHSLSVGGNRDGISFSQTASQAGGSFGNGGSGISASQSSSFAAGLSGISGADANSFNLNHPTFGDKSQANVNSFALGQATSSAQGNVVNGLASSGAQSAVGSSQSSASSISNIGSPGSNSQGQGHRNFAPSWTNVAPNYETGGINNPNGRPNDRWQHRCPAVSPNGYRPNDGHLGQHVHNNGNYQNSGISSSNSHRPNWGSPNRGSSGNRQYWTQRPSASSHSGSSSPSWNREKPNLQISGVSASSSSTSNSPGSSSFGQSSSQSGFGPNGPASWTTNTAQTSGNAQTQAQGAAAAVGQDFHGNTQASFASGSIAGVSHEGGQSHGISTSGNRGENSRGQVTSHATGNGHSQGTANSGSVGFVKFPNDDDSQDLPMEFFRYRQTKNFRDDQQKKRFKTRNPVGEIISDLTDTVADLFDV